MPSLNVGGVAGPHPNPLPEGEGADLWCCAYLLLLLRGFGVGGDLLKFIRSRRAHGAMPACGHAEPQRGTEWRGRDLLVSFGSFWVLLKGTRRKGATLSSRYRSNG